MKKSSSGFTIVELLIVVVVIAILAAISMVAYAGIQQRARDSIRKSDIKTIAKALEAYYVDNGTYPSSNCSSNCSINSAWSTTSDGSWAHLESQLVPKYVSALPKDPQASTATAAGIYGGYNYDYVRLTSEWCESTPSSPMYLLSYRLESSAQKGEIIGSCPGVQPYDYTSSQYMVTKK